MSDSTTSIFLRLLARAGIVAAIAAAVIFIGTQRADAADLGGSLGADSLN